MEKANSTCPPKYDHNGGSHVVVERLVELCRIVGKIESMFSEIISNIFAKILTPVGTVKN